MKPKLHFQTVLPGEPAIIWAVYYGPPADRRVRFANNKAEARAIGKEVIAGPLVENYDPKTWPEAFYFYRSKLRTESWGRYIVNSHTETIHEKP